MIIYKAVNKINQKCYIGQTTKSLKTRKNWHNQSVNQNSRYQFHCAIRKYGIENFDWIILEKCNKEQLDAKERYYIEKYDTYKKGYNMTLGGDNPMNIPELREKVSKSQKGKIISKEQRKKIRKALLGRKNPEQSKRMKENNPAKRQEVKAKWKRSGENHHFFGKKHSKKHIENIKKGIKKTKRNGKYNSNAKNWVLISPVGMIYEFCGNLEKKIREITGYSSDTIRYKYKGDYKGWMLREV